MKGETKPNRKYHPVKLVNFNHYDTRSLPYKFFQTNNHAGQAAKVIGKYQERHQAQPAFICSNSPMETPKQNVKSIQKQQ